MKTITERPVGSGSTAQNRRLDDLAQVFRTPFERWLAEARANGFKILVVETFRSKERQEYLYSFGRTRPGNIVTYTLDSAHEYGVAADIVPLDPKGQPDWSPAAYDRLYRAVPPGKYGLELLSFEKPHIQLAGGQAKAKQLGLRANVIVGSRWPV